MSITPERDGPGLAAHTTGGRDEGLFWSLVLIWAGLVVGADALDLLPGIGSADAWNWIFLGAGTLAGIGCVRRLLSDRRRDPDLSDYGVAAVLLVLGLGGFMSVRVVTAAVLLVVGGLLLATTARRADPTSRPAAD